MPREQLVDLAGHLLTSTDADEIRSDHQLVTGGMDHLDDVVSVGGYGAC